MNTKLISQEECRGVSAQLAEIAPNLSLFFYETMVPSVYTHLNTLLTLAAKHPHVYASQSFLGKHSNSRLGKPSHRKTSNIACGILDKASLVLKKYNHWRTCDYMIASCFQDPRVQHILSALFPIFRKPINFLSSLFSTNVTLNKGTLFKRNGYNGSSIYAGVKTLISGIAEPPSTVGFCKKGVNQEKSGADPQQMAVRTMITPEQREWIQAHKSDPAMQEFLLSPKIKPLLYTPVVEELTRMLDLDQRESLKLVAYHNAALQYLRDEIGCYLKGTKSLRIEIRDKIGWVNGILTKYSAQQKLPVFWKWYFTVCEILQIKALKGDEPHKPWYVPGKEVSQPAEPKKLAMYKLYKPVVTPHDEKVSKCRASIVGMEKIIASPHAYYKPCILFTKDEWLVMQQAMLSNYRKELQELEEL